jgi:hypothetical protein
MRLWFTIAAGPRQRSHSPVRVLPDSLQHFTVWDSRVPQPGGPDPRIYIPQEEGGPVILTGTGFSFSSPPTTHRATVEVFYQFTRRHIPEVCNWNVTTEGRKPSEVLKIIVRCYTDLCTSMWIVVLCGCSPEWQKSMSVVCTFKFGIVCICRCFIVILTC